MAHAAGLAVVDLWLRWIGPLGITLFSACVAAGTAWRYRGVPADLAAAAAAVDQQAGLKDRVASAWANCGRQNWSPLVARQVADALAHLTTAGSMPTQSLADRPPYLSVLLLTGVLAVVWLEPLLVGRTADPVVDRLSESTKTPEPADAAAVIRGYRSAAPAGHVAAEPYTSAVPADEAVTQRYFELIERGADTDR